MTQETLTHYQIAALYVLDGRTQRDIAAWLGCSERRVRGALKAMGIGVGPRRNLCTLAGTQRHETAKAKRRAVRAPAGEHITRPCLRCDQPFQTAPLRQGGAAICPRCKTKRREDQIEQSGAYDPGWYGVPRVLVSS